ncbi:MAG: carboxylate-amine ligase [Myxococcota bacterium]|nr:carboxylate-amine ligase [Myxococcota bacterium]
MSQEVLPLTVGIEEEYLLVNRDTCDLADDPPQELIAECEARHEGQVSPELLRSQIEVGTRVCTSVREVADELASLRRTVSEVAGEHGLAPIAAASHPFAKWAKQKHTPKARYATLVSELQAVGRRLVTCGMHVHIGIQDPDLRIDMMNQLRYFCPHLLAFSTSSPFWEGQDTGLKSYRLSVFDGLPRTGLPEYFDSYAEYERFTQVMMETGLLRETSMLWWDIRPNARFPTLELRTTDICTRIEDGIAIAAFYVCLASKLYRLRRQNQKWRIYSASLIKENRWRAQRYGLDEGLVDFGRSEIVPWPDMLDEIMSLLGEDAERLDCVKELEHLRVIYERGTSAHQQLKVYKEAKEGGASEEDAMLAVVRRLIDDTVRDL